MGIRQADRRAVVVEVVVIELVGLRVTAIKYELEQLTITTSGCERGLACKENSAV